MKKSQLYEKADSNCITNKQGEKHGKRISIKGNGKGKLW